MLGCVKKPVYTLLCGWTIITPSRALIRALASPRTSSCVPAPGGRPRARYMIVYAFFSVLIRPRRTASMIGHASDRVSHLAFELMSACTIF